MLMQVRNQFTICPASTSEAADIARLALIASDGLTGITWEAMRGPGETVLDAGARRAAKRRKGFSYHNAEVAFGRSGVIAAIVSFPLEPEDVSDFGFDIPAVFRPLVALEQQAVSTWNINLLATYPEARGQGAATALIAEVGERAAYEGFTRLSLIVRDANPAQRLYTRLGFREVARAPIVKGDLPLHGRDWVLMFREVGV
ncbi:acetyltransferase (GNAT) family protein [Aliiruegeria haliotis]|uniref:Acetyltransferase (GNAT) family protein n=1 Tax=Aliiruegeria haliotis TaxID=1280846 RepID=A0A2T0RM13_9RHOB|nr:GNAT family N-acetyltransferase [Aliiruegeria haliotis]PRY22208.1 acetyltransferase (GNAT) family protein [Aliiruegeria haliotis]